LRYFLKVNQPEEKTCKRCGKCCLADMIDYALPEEYERWKAEGREDILHVVENEHAVWAGDHFISSLTGKYIYGCPFLRWEDDYFSCSIYEVRPSVCRNFRPGSSEICPLWEPDKYQK